MVSPIDYSITGIPDPREEFIKGYQLTEGLKADQVAKQQAAMHSQALSAAMQKAMSPDATAADYRNLALVQSQGKEAKDLIQGVTDEKHQSMLGTLAPIFGALNSGNVESAKTSMTALAEAAKNSGDERTYQIVQAGLRTVETDPQLAKAVVGHMIMSVPGGDKVLEKSIAMQKAPGEIEKEEALTEESKARTAFTKEQTSWYGMKTQEEINEIKSRIENAKLKAESGGDFDAISSKYYEDGTVVFSGNNGTTRVVNNEGVVVTGKDAAETIYRAKDFEAKQQGMREGERVAENLKQKEIDRSYDKISKITENISNLKLVSDAIDKGANVGWLQDKFPSWRASTIELQTAVNRLGLDITSMYTFGALSEKELAMAKATAVPPGMQGEALKQWILDKVAAQDKARDYLYDYTQFLAGGGSRADWEKEARRRYKGEGTPTPPPSGGTGAAPVVGATTSRGTKLVSVEKK